MSFIRKFFVFMVSWCLRFRFFPEQIREMLMWPIASRVLGLAYTQVTSLKDGFRMYGSMEDILTRNILFLGKFCENLWEPETSHLLEKLAVKSKHILVAGSHIGYMTLKVANSTSGIVHAFEPIPKLYSISKKNIELNEDLKERVRLTKSALGETEGIIPMYVEDIRSSVIPYSGGHLKHNEVVDVSVTTIDAYAERYSVNFDLLLLDIEGFEWHALNGAKKTLESKPVLIVEISPKVLRHTNITPHMMIERLKNMGYRLTYLDQDNDYANIYAQPI